MKKCSICGAYHEEGDECPDTENQELAGNGLDNPYNELVGGMERGGSPENDGTPEAQISNIKPLPEDVQEEIRRSLRETENSSPVDFGLHERMRSSISN